MSDDDDDDHSEPSYEIWHTGCGSFLVSACGQSTRSARATSGRDKRASEAGRARCSAKHKAELRRGAFVAPLSSSGCLVFVIALLLAILSAYLKATFWLTAAAATATANWPKQVAAKQQELLSVSRSRNEPEISFGGPINSTDGRQQSVATTRATISTAAGQTNNLKQVAEQKSGGAKLRRSPLEPAASSILDAILGISSTTKTSTLQPGDEENDQQEAHKPKQTLNTNSGKRQRTQAAHAGHSSGRVIANGPAYPLSLSQSSDKVTLPGDILLGGLFPIHMKGTKVECGQINRDRGIQRLEAMLYALDRINADSKLLPNIKLGAILLDSCSSSTYALNQSLEFIRASINTVESSAFECKDKSSPRPKYGSKMIAGVIGGSYSEVSLQVANLLRLFRIPQVSYASTGTALSDKTLYDLFARTVPSDMFQARAIADIVHKLGWSYVSLVSSEGLYGDSGSKEFVKQASMRKICIATHEKISPTIGEQAIDAMVQKLSIVNATGVVLFTRAEDTRELLLAVKRAKLVHNFAWVAADGWGTHQKLVEGVEEVAWGAITVELQAKAIPGFDQYMKALTPWANARNPWFSEYWQEWFDCQLQPNLLQQQRLASGYSRRAATADQSNEAGWLSPSPAPSSTDNSQRYDANGDYEEATDGNDSRRARRSLVRPASCTSGLPSPLDAESLKDNTSSSSSSSIKPCGGRASPTNATIGGGGIAREKHLLRRRSANNFESAAETDGAIKQFCSPNLKISESNGYRQEQKVQFVVDAVYAMAHALHEAWLNLCGGQPGEVCEALKELNGGKFYTEYLLKVSFKDLAGSEVKFDNRGDGLGRYNIYNFRQVRPQNVPPNRELVAAAAAAAPNDSIAELDLLGGGSPDAAPIDKLAAIAEASYQQERETNAGQTVTEHIYTSNVEFEYSTVGRWTEDEYGLALDEIQFFQGDRSVPESFCSKPCELGQAKMMRANDNCCWMCKTCQPYEFLPDEFSCQDCGIGRWPMPNKTSCYDLPQKILRWDSIYSLISLSISCLGIALTLFVTIIFIRYIDTPVVKASGRELSFILLAGVAICHMATFVLLARPTTFTCGGQRFLVNFGFALMYASLLVKTNRISRIFNCARKSAKRPSFISPKSQMLITSILVAIQIFLTIVWFVFEPPGIRADSPEGKRDEVILKCKVKGKSFILSLVYNMILITTCTVYAVKTRKIPENFNESKFIGFTMYTTIVIWLAFVTMFFGTNNSYEIQINTMCVCISLSAYVTLFCLFSPKISIILLHPDKNVRKLTMNSATYKRAFKPVSSVASVDGRNNFAPSGSVAQPEPPSGGPMSTTSNVLNLAESQAARLQESSVVSNVVNSNSAGSNCSQKTATNLSQQLALVGICSNCGAHQHLSSVPIGSIAQASNATSTSAASSSLIGGGKFIVGNQQRNTSVNQTFGDSVSSRLANGLAPKQQVAAVDQQRQWLCDTGGQRCTRSAGLNKAAKQAPCVQYKLSTSEPTAGAAAANVSLSSSAAAQVLHHRIGVQNTAVHYKAKSQQVWSKLRRTPSSDERVEAADLTRHWARGGDSGAEQQRKSSLNDARSSGKRQQMASMSRLNEMTSFTSSDRQANDESISSLANDSFMNTSLETAPCHAASFHHEHNHNEQLQLQRHHHHHAHRRLSTSAVHVSLDTVQAQSHQAGVGGHNLAQCLGDHGANGKGSDSILCNQSLQSTDYCSDCCPSPCQCSCPVCSSNGGDESEAALCLQAQSSLNEAELRRASAELDERITAGRRSARVDTNQVEDEDGERSNVRAEHNATCIHQHSSGGPKLSEEERTSSSGFMENEAKSVAWRRKSESAGGAAPLASEAEACHSRAEVSLTMASLRALQECVATRFSGGASTSATSERRAGKAKARRSQTAMEMRTIVKYGADDVSSGSIVRQASSYTTQKLCDYQDNDPAANDDDPEENEDDDDDDEDDLELLAAAAAAPIKNLSRFTSATAAVLPFSSKNPSVETRDTQACASVAYALQAAATSALGATFSGGPMVFFGSGGRQAGARAQPVAHAREQQQQQQKQQQPMAQRPICSSGGGTIQASLELVRQSNEARRRSMEPASRQHRKSGCFNYHDEYEYSYGLVESDSERDDYYYEEDDDDEEGRECVSSLISGADNNGGYAKSNEGVQRAAKNATDDNDGDDKDDVDASQEGEDYFKRSNDDHRQRQERKKSTTIGRQQQQQSNKRASHSAHYQQPEQQRQPMEQTIHNSPTKRCHTAKLMAHHQAMGTGGGSAGASRQARALELDEHRINSVALITATLSAGGAIVESSGPSASQTPASTTPQGDHVPRTQTSQFHAKMDSAAGSSNAAFSKQEHKQQVTTAATRPGVNEHSTDT